LKWRTPIEVPIEMAKKAAAGGGKRKKRRRKMKLSLKSRTVKGESYEDNVGWSRVSEEEKAIGPAEPEVVNHQCSLCGSMNRIPKPKRDRYKVKCAYTECGHEDEIGI